MIQRPKPSPEAADWRFGAWGESGMEEHQSVGLLKRLDGIAASDPFLDLPILQPLLLFFPAPQHEDGDQAQQAASPQRHSLPAVAQAHDDEAANDPNEAERAAD